MHYSYTPHGVCSKNIAFDIIDGKVRNLHFTGGCSGNTQGLSALIEGMDAAQAAERLSGLKCGMKDTSCPDQLAKALQQQLEKAAKEAGENPG